MANINAPKGLVPKRHLDGSAWNGQYMTAYIPASDGTATFIGDVVIHNSTSGAAGLVVNGQDLEGVPQVIRFAVGTAGQNYFGVVVGFAPDPTSLITKHRAASTNRIAYVVTDPTVIFEIQEDAVTTPIVAASIGLNASLSTTAGSLTTGVSGVQLISASVATTATLPLKVLGLAKRPDNAFNTAGASTDNAKFEVMLNTSVFEPNVAGI